VQQSHIQKSAVVIGFPWQAKVTWSSKKGAYRSRI